jgi:hypothetical protein
VCRIFFGTHYSTHATTITRSAELQPNHYVVRDANRQQLAYVNYENEPGRRSAAKLLTRDETRHIAANFGNLPKLLQQRRRA